VQGTGVLALPRRRGRIGDRLDLGHLIDGTQAEYVRVPFAETSVYPLPDGVTPQEGAMLSDILPTGHEIGVRYGQVKVGDVMVVPST
jgi:alcohol dehydrogenase